MNNRMSKQFNLLLYNIISYNKSDSDEKSAMDNILYSPYSRQDNKKKIRKEKKKKRMGGESS